MATVAPATFTDALWQTLGDVEWLFMVILLAVLGVVLIMCVEFIRREENPLSAYLHSNDLSSDRRKGVNKQ